MRTNSLIHGMLMALALAAPEAMQAGEIGHYTGGLANIRDFFIPPAPGFYGIVYNYYYTTDRLNNKNGDKVDSVTINPPGGGSGVTLNVDVNVDMFACVPVLMWVAPWKPLGASYAAYIAPTFANANLSASLANAQGRGGKVDSSSFGVGDLFVQPVWLDWSFKHWEVTLGYGFYAPVGKYDTKTYALPVVGPVTVESIDNIGYGFWTHQFQSAVAWYPREDRTIIAMAALTYEINTEKEDFNLTPGEALSLNWGASKYFPLGGANKFMLEVGPAGYSTWQITDDTGSNAKKGGVHDQVHAAGGQLGLTYLPWSLVVNFHAFCEFTAVDRFQGEVYGLTVSKKF